MEVLAVVAGALVCAIVAFVFIGKYFEARARLTDIYFALYDYDPKAGRYPHPDDDRYAPYILEMAKDINYVRDVAKGAIENEV